MSFFRNFRKAGSSSTGGDSPMSNGGIDSTNTTPVKGDGEGGGGDEVSLSIITTTTTIPDEAGGTTTTTNADISTAEEETTTTTPTAAQTPVSATTPLSSSSLVVDTSTPISIKTPTNSTTSIPDVVGEGGGGSSSIKIIKVEDEPDEDPERVRLEGVVRQRDAAISALEKARQEKQVQLSQLETDLENERLMQMKEALIHKIDTERIKRQTQNVEERLKSLEADMQDKAAIHEYANLIKGVAPKAGVDNQYVMKLQSQLQKAVKKMEATTEQMKELDESSATVIDTLTKEIADLVEERCRTELELRKQMDVLEIQKRDMQAEYEDRIRENLKTLQALKAKAAKQITIDELESELEETESKLNELHRIQEKQQKTIEQLNKSLQQHQQEVM